MAEALRTAWQEAAPHIEQARYAEALSVLASLNRPVARFFDEVLVMAEEEAVRTRRLRLLAGV